MRRCSCFLPLAISLLWAHTAIAHPDPKHTSSLTINKDDTVFGESSRQLDVQNGTP